MKLKESTIKDFAEALGETDELGEDRIRALSQSYHKNTRETKKMKRKFNGTL